MFRIAVLPHSPGVVYLSIVETRDQNSLFDCSSPVVLVHRSLSALLCLSSYEPVFCFLLLVNSHSLMDVAQLQKDEIKVQKSQSLVFSPMIFWAIVLSQNNMKVLIHKV